MKIGFLSMFTVLFVLHGTDCSAYFSEQTSGIVPPPLTKIPMKPIINQTKVLKTDHQDQEKPKNIVKWGSFRDGRSFADVVKGVKKSDNSNDKEVSKREKKPKKSMQKLSKINFEQNEYDARKIQQNSKRRQSAKIKDNKKHQSAHKGKLYNAR
jgi:hypothetical protein